MVKQELKIKKEMSLSPPSQSSPSSSSPKIKSKKNKIKKYKGVRMRSWGSWVSEIRAPNKKTRIWLGSYSTAEAAARAYDVALLCLKGPQANLNFPSSASSHLLQDEKTILSPKSIQKIAAQAANNSFDLSAPSSSAASSPSDHDKHHDDNDDDGMQSLIGSFVDNHVSLMNSSSSWYDDEHNGMFFFDDRALFDYSTTNIVDAYSSDFKGIPRQAAEQKPHPDQIYLLGNSSGDFTFYDDADIPLWSFS